MLIEHILIILAVEPWLWSPGCGILAVESWLWSPGCGILAVVSWPWNPDCGILAVESRRGVLAGAWSRPQGVWARLQPPPTPVTEFRFLAILQSVTASWFWMTWHGTKRFEVSDDLWYGKTQNAHIEDDTA